VREIKQTDNFCAKKEIHKRESKRSGGRNELAEIRENLHLVIVNVVECPEF